MLFTVAIAYRADSSVPDCLRILQVTDVKWVALLKNLILEDLFLFIKVFVVIFNNNLNNLIMPNLVKIEVIISINVKITQISKHSISFYQRSYNIRIS